MKENYTFLWSKRLFLATIGLVLGIMLLVIAVIVALVLTALFFTFVAAMLGGNTEGALALQFIAVGGGLSTLLAVTLFLSILSLKTGFRAMWHFVLMEEAEKVEEKEAIKHNEGV